MCANITMKKCLNGSGKVKEKKKVKIPPSRDDKELQIP